MTRETRRGAGFVTARRNKSGEMAYQARWPEADASGAIRIRAKTFPTLDEAEAWLRSRDRVTRRRRPLTPAELTVDALLAEMLTRATTRLSERTILTYRDRARKMISPYLGSRRLIDLTTLDVQRWIDRLTADGYKPATVHAAVAVLHSVLRDAAVLGIIERNLAEGIRRPGIEQLRVQTWTADEARRLLAVVRDDELYGALYHVALATGMRPGELRALPWADVDLGRRRIIVNRTMTKDAAGRETIGHRTKTRRGRAVALPEAVVAILKSHRALQNRRRQRASGWHDLDLVFDRGDGMWLGQNTWRYKHQQFCAAAGVPVIRLHDIRHSSASLELEAGTHIKVVQDRLGHSSVQMTIDRYSHVSEDLQRRAADALGKRLFEDADDDTASRATTS